MNPLEKLLAAAAKTAQIAPTHPEKKSQIALAESAATIRCTVASIRAALESETSRPAKFALFVGDESPLPDAKQPKSRRAAKA
jgi:hypothetical protein